MTRAGFGFGYDDGDPGGGCLWFVRDYPGDSRLYAVHEIHGLLAKWLYSRLLVADRADGMEQQRDSARRVARALFHIWRWATQRAEFAYGLPEPDLFGIVRDVLAAEAKREAP